MTTFFIADTHFFDKRIIYNCNRPFKNVEEMSDILIENWNKTVKNTDVVWILGDFFRFINNEDDPHDNKERGFNDIVNNLKGEKNLIIGNHDIKSLDFYRSKFNFVSPYPILFNNYFLLSHEPLLLSQTTPYFNLYGHVHNDERFEDTLTSICVSVERINYRPISLEEINDRINRCIF